MTKKFKIYGTGFYGSVDGSLHYGFHDDNGSEFYIAWRPSAKAKSFSKNVADELKRQWKDYRQDYKNVMDIQGSEPLEKKQRHHIYRQIEKWLKRLSNHFEEMNKKTKANEVKND